MILTDREIQIALENEQIFIDPRPRPDAYSSTSVDLTLAERGLRWKAIQGMSLRPGFPGYKYTGTTDLQERISLVDYHLKSKEFVLAWTAETVRLPITSRVAARVGGKSSLARLGIGIHVTAPTIHAGFKGQIQLEMFNFGPLDIILDPGMLICQLIFEQTTGTPEKGYAGMFVGQKAEPRA
jgi:dCTP deaminase